ncbi:hypothetical protein A0J61_06059 [Choanephora cucurbitarum]|uniref:Transposase Tc1-like domain-containing protein n=1 Tax=Choanephora cucurbitarum TaxID=101091 RepID=A0A1C7NA24_9FUNG|nr:hypothetical protein A0J61_06059 [Choanephora cucurbitarum]
MHHIKSKAYRLGLTQSGCLSKSYLPYSNTEIIVPNDITTHKPSLTDRHKASRLNWAAQHANWNNEQWKSMVWLDKVRSGFENNDCAARVIRKHMIRGEKDPQQYQVD